MTKLLYWILTWYWWDILCEKDIWACTNVKTFRGENAVTLICIIENILLKTTHTFIQYSYRADLATEFLN